MLIIKKFLWILLVACFAVPVGQAQNEPLKLIRYDYREGKFDKDGTLVEQGEISELVEKAFAEARTALDEIARLSHETRNFKNTPEAMEHVYTRLSRTIEPIIFMKDVSSNPTLRKEAVLYEKKMKEFVIEMSLRKDLYQAFEAFRKNMKNDFSSLDASERRLLEIMAKDFRQSGVWLEGEKFERVRALKNELAALETEFKQNLNENKDTLFFTPEELEGMPELFLKDLEREKHTTGRYIVAVKPDTYVPIMENAVRSETRKRMYMAWVSREAPRNTHLLERAVEIRTQLAPLLGYHTWVDYRTDGRMAENAERVRVFLDSLREKLVQKNQEDLKALLDIKRETDPNATSIEMWEKDYYANQLKKRLFSFDPEVVREYFPMQRVIDGTFQIYSNLFGVTFREVTNADVWDKEVKLIQVLDAKTGGHLGYFYMDLFPRDGKYNHFAAAGLIQAGVTPEGAYQRPINCLLGNFNRPSEATPSLLSHSEVETMFHELGHIMNDMLTVARYGSYSGNAVVWDFVEAPSQMLENWVWTPEVLDILSGHYKDGTKLPANLKAGLLASAKFNTGALYSRQIFYATLDYILHTASPKDILALVSRLAKELTSIALPAGGEQLLASFGHFMGGYDAGYYGYLYSEVYAQSMWEIFEQGGIFNQEIGMRYRRAVPEHGGDRLPMESIREFRGSDPTPDAFFRKIGISGQTVPLPRVSLGDTLTKLEKVLGEIRSSGEKHPVFTDTELLRLSNTVARDYVAWVERQRESGRRVVLRDAFSETTQYLGFSQDISDALLKGRLLERLQGLSGRKLTVPKVSAVLFDELRTTVRR